MREVLFELLGSRIENARFLDLCAGSGAVGIEALSRGAGHVTFVDRSPKMCSFITSNLSLCDVPAEQSIIIEDEAAHFLTSTELHNDLWDITFFDPPYTADYSSVIEIFSKAGLLKKKGGVLVVEHRCDNVLGETFNTLYRWRVVRQGDSCLSFYERKK